VPEAGTHDPAVDGRTTEVRREPSALTEYSHDIVDALEDVNVPSFLVDPAGVIRWLNEAAMRIVGDVRGRQFTSVVVPHDAPRSRETFTRLMLQTTRVADNKVEILDQEGRIVRSEVCSVSLVQGNRVIGIFGQVPRFEVELREHSHPALTPRQTQVLKLLGQGLATHQIAEALHLSDDTVRNHIRHLMRALGVHSRLQAVAVARRDGLL
jgi:PAS domain S-box-containing protein